MKVQLRRAARCQDSDGAVPADIHRFAADGREHVLLVNGSRVFTVNALVAAELDAAGVGGAAVGALLESLSLSADPFVDDRPVDDPPVRALSLAIAQKCNMGCTYCYAQAGTFGGEARNMTEHAAHAAVRLLFRDAKPGEHVNLAFLGGEPLTNRGLLRDCTERAAILGKEKNVRVGFSITTNGTLLRPDDGDFFESHGFAVTVSIDAIGEAHDALRPLKGGQSTYAKIIDNVRPLLRQQRRMQVTARATVTPSNMSLRETLDGLLFLGFQSVGFSPMLASPSATGEMSEDNLKEMLAQMITCGEEFERRCAQGERYAFQNMSNAMREIHRGTHRPYPCGAGAGYLGVAADGALAACHRFVADPSGQLGNVHDGINVDRQREWLRERHVHRQEPCRSCWARYLCGGGCHHEVINRGRPACNYIRGWLHYCLGAYARLLARNPGFFAA